MRNFFSGIVMLIVALLVILAIVGFVGWARLPDVVANHLSKKMKVSVEIGNMGLKSNTIEVDRFEIGNPSGSILPKAFSLETMSINAPFSTYFQQDVVIDSITMDDIYLGLEFKSISGTEGNWTTIMSNYKQGAAHDTSNKHVLIKKLIITNITVDLVFETGTNQKIKRLQTIPRMEFTDVTSSGGIPTDQIVQSVLGQMLKSVFVQENLKNMLDTILDIPDTPWNNVIKPLKDLFQ